MARGTTLLTVFCFLAIGAFAQASDAERYEAVIYARTLEEPQGPTLVGNYLVFSYVEAEGPSPRYVAAAFDHENYGQLHLFSKTAAGLYALIYEIPTDIDELSYRLIVDGVWTSDPANPPEESGSKAPLSTVRIGPSETSPAFHRSPTVDRGVATFVLRRSDVEGRFILSIEGDHVRFARPFEELDVRLVGSFDGYDPYLHVLRRFGGEYRIELPLPKGEHGYYFLIDGKRVLDPANSEYLYGPNRSRFSKVTVES